MTHTLRSALVGCLRSGDVVIANDAATLPASLAAVHARTGAEVEVRLAGYAMHACRESRHFTAVLFGAGDHTVRTEERAPPPPVQAGDVLQMGAVAARVDALLDHPRFVSLTFQANPAELWRLLARSGRPIQYAHVPERLSLWDVWTPIAASPIAFEAPSAGFAIDWQTVLQMQAKGVKFAALTHAAGISSTGDPTLDARLPFPEPYYIPVATAEVVTSAHHDGRRVIAIGTTVVRALEHAWSDARVQSGHGVAHQRIGPATRLNVIDALLSGTHEVGTSHYELLRAFVSERVLRELSGQLEARRYLTHEFGDSVLLELADARRSLRDTWAATGELGDSVREARASARTSLQHAPAATAQQCV